MTSFSNLWTVQKQREREEFLGDYRVSRERERERERESETERERERGKRKE